MAIINNDGNGNGNTTAVTETTTDTATSSKAVARLPIPELAPSVTTLPERGDTLGSLLTLSKKTQ